MSNQSFFFKSTWLVSNHIFTETQLSIDALVKTYSENMQQIYRGTPTPECDFSKIDLQLIESTLRVGCSPVNLRHIFRTPFVRTIQEGYFCFSTLSLFNDVRISLALTNRTNRTLVCKSFFEFTHMLS